MSISLTEDVAISRRIITRPGSEQVIRYAFEMARQKKASRVTCVHKANIMKITDGLFLNTFHKIAQEYPELVTDDIIVDDLCMKMVTRPASFDVLVLTNLQGDIVSDLCAGLVGGLGFAPSANIGDDICIFEAVHGTAPDIAGKNIANPTALLLSGIAMLHHLGLTATAAKIENALLYTLEQGVHTGDFGDKSTPALNTTDFAAKIIENFGQLPAVGARTADPDQPIKIEVPELKENLLIHSTTPVTKTLAGVDFFIDSILQPEAIAAIAQKYSTDTLPLLNISNRGTQVWPGGSKFTVLVDNFTLRFEAPEGQTVTQQGIIDLYAQLASDFQITSVETLLEINGQKVYSLAQGQ